MLKKLVFAAVMLMLFSSCVSRTTIKEPGLKGANASGKANSETKVIWFWDKDF